MSCKKNFYSVSRGETTGIFTRWSKCELSIHKYSNAVFKGFETIDEAMAFLIAGGTYITRINIPVYDDTQTVKRPTDFDHVCENEATCTIASLDISEQSTLDDTIVPSNDEDSSSELNTSDINFMNKLEPSEDNTSLKIPMSKVEQKILQSKLTIHNMKIQLVKIKQIVQ